MFDTSVIVGISATIVSFAVGYAVARRSPLDDSRSASAEKQDTKNEGTDKVNHERRVAPGNR